jgi:hypothetical protein
MLICASGLTIARVCTRADRKLALVSTSRIGAGNPRGAIRRESDSEILVPLIAVNTQLAGRRPLSHVKYFLVCARKTAATRLLRAAATVSTLQNAPRV